jgi:hypothetical protein
MPLIGAALWALAYAGKWREFGTVGVVGTVLSAADGVAIYKFGGKEKVVTAVLYCCRLFVGNDDVVVEDRAGSAWALTVRLDCTAVSFPCVLGSSDLVHYPKS